jgi:hypothetical protein
LVDREGKPEAGRVLTLDETGYEGTSDANGVVTIGRLVPGPYSGRLRDTILEPIGVTLKTSLEFVVADSETIVKTITAATAADYVEAACRRTGGADPDPTGAWFIARLLDSTGTPLEHAQWRASRSDDGGAGGAADDVAGFTQIAGASGTSSSDGLVQYCGSGLSAKDVVRLEVRPTKKDHWLAAGLHLKGPITAAPLRITQPGRTPR